jgi:hypothetical protein
LKVVVYSVGMPKSPLWAIPPIPMTTARLSLISKFARCRRARRATATLPAPVRAAPSAQHFLTFPAEPAGHSGV